MILFSINAEGLIRNWTHTVADTGLFLWKRKFIIKNFTLEAKSIYNILWAHSFIKFSWNADTEHLIQKCYLANQEIK